MVYEIWLCSIFFLPISTITSEYIELSDDLGLYPPAKRRKKLQGNGNQGQVDRVQTVRHTCTGLHTAQILTEYHITTSTLVHKNKAT